MQLRLAGAGALALAMLAVAPTEARQARHHRHHHVAGCGELAVVRAPSGATACVAHAARASFQAFVSALEATGYHIDFMGGWRAHGSCSRCDMHPRALAIDINQTGRNRVTRRFPPGVTELARSFGLLHGAVWRDADTGHFELAGVHHYGARLVRRHASHRHLARAIAPADPHQNL